MYPSASAIVPRLLRRFKLLDDSQACPEQGIFRSVIDRLFEGIEWSTGISVRSF